MANVFLFLSLGTACEGTLGARGGGGCQLPALGRDEGLQSSVRQTEGADSGNQSSVIHNCRPSACSRASPVQNAHLAPQPPAALLTFPEPLSRGGVPRVEGGLWAPLLSGAGSLTSLCMLLYLATSILVSEFTPTLSLQPRQGQKGELGLARTELKPTCWLCNIGGAPNLSEVVFPSVR